MYEDCAEGCEAHLRPSLVGQHTADCGVAKGAANLLGIRHGLPWQRGTTTFAGVTRQAVLFPDGEIRVWVGGAWVRAATEKVEVSA